MTGNATPSVQPRGEILLATTNRGKVAEMRDLLFGTGWQVRRLQDNAPEYAETGSTFADNARGKAAFYARHVGGAALADDSGLQIDALGGAPGVYSARYIDPSIPQTERNRRVLELLRDVPDPERRACFVCHLVLALPEGLVHETTGMCAGVITRSPRGDGGFGYDPIFESVELGKTFAELERAEKSRLSHRGRAVRAMVEFLETWTPPAVGEGVS